MSEHTKKLYDKWDVHLFIPHSDFALLSKKAAEAGTTLEKLLETRLRVSKSALMVDCKYVYTVLDSEHKDTPVEFASETVIGASHAFVEYLLQLLSCEAPDKILYAPSHAVDKIDVYARELVQKRGAKPVLYEYAQSLHAEPKEMFVFTFTKADDVGGYAILTEYETQLVCRCHGLNKKDATTGAFRQMFELLLQKSPKFKQYMNSVSTKRNGKFW